MTDAPPPLTPRSAPIDLGPHDVPVATPFLADVAAPGPGRPDGVGHVSNIEFVRWLDRAAELHADSLGYTRQRLLDDGIMWFVARHEIDYVGEAHPGDGLVVATWVRDVARVKSWRDYRIIRPSDGALVCRAATLWVLVSLETRRPVRIPDAMRERLDPAAGRAAGRDASCTSA
jgi:acyl-CoA thioester hydrolase